MFNLGLVLMYFLTEGAITLLIYVHCMSPFSLYINVKFVNES